MVSDRLYRSLPLRKESLFVKRIIDLLYQREDRLTVPIYDCDREMDFACMGHTCIARDFGFSAYVVGGVERIHAVNFSTPSQARQYPWSDVSHTAMDQELEMFTAWRSRFPHLLGGGCFGPLTVASDILGMENCTRLAIRQPEILYTVLDHVTDYMITLAQAEQDLGAEAFWVAEPLASLFAPRLFMSLSGRYIKRIFESVDVPGFLHVCGKTTRHTPAMVQTGAQVLSIDWMTDLPACLATVPEEIVIMGNVDPMLFWQEDEAVLRAAVSKVLEQTRDYKNFILSSGCQIPGQSLPERVELFFRMAREFPLWSNEEYRQIRRLSHQAAGLDDGAFAALCLEEGVPEEIAQAALRMARARKIT